MSGNGKTSIQYFSLDNNGSLYPYSLDKKNIYQVINEQMDDRILNKEAVALCKNNKIVAAVKARKNFVKYENDFLDVYLTKNFSDKMTFSEGDVIVGNRISPGHVSIDMNYARKIRYGENRGRTDYTKNQIGIVKNKLSEIAAEQNIDDILGFCESGKGCNFLCRIDHHLAWNESAEKITGNLGRKIDKELEPKVIA